MKQEQLETYMGTAILHSKLSKATRAKVGSCLVTKQGVILVGVNGTPTGASNEIEDTRYTGFEFQTFTRPEVIHSELNCILKAAREGVSCIGSTLFVTLSPCISCAAMLIQAGVTNVYYKEAYRDSAGIEYLLKNKVKISQLKV